MRRTYPEATEYGMARFLEDLDCMGDECQVAAKEGRCFISRHHLYFPEAYYLSDPVARRFRNSDVNIKSIPLCQHIELHKRYVMSPRPRREHIEAFSDELRILGRLGTVLSAIRSMQAFEDALQSERPRDVHRNLGRNLHDYLDRFVELQEEAEGLLVMTNRFELIQPEQTAAHLGSAALLAA